MIILFCHTWLGFRHRSFVVMAGVAAACSSALIFPTTASAQTDVATWGKSHRGLQARVLSVASETDESKTISFADAERSSVFDGPENVTLLVQLKNVGERPIKLFGVRDRANTQESPRGRSNSDYFAPHLFRCELFDAADRRIDGPDNEMHPLDAMMQVMQARVEILKPTETLVALLRPGRWDAGLTRSIVKGDYRVRLHYSGVSAPVQQRFKHYDRPGIPDNLWSGDVVAADIPIHLKAASPAVWSKPAWGAPVAGLRAALQLKKSGATRGGKIETASLVYPHGSRVEVQFLIQNVGDRAISFWSDDYRQNDELTLIHDDGSEDETLTMTAYSGMSAMRHWNLRPKEVAALRSPDIQLLTVGQLTDEPGAPAKSLYAVPGKYGVQYDIHFGGWSRREGMTLQDIPEPNDWQQTLRTGVAPLEIRD